MVLTTPANRDGQPWEHINKGTYGYESYCLGARVCRHGVCGLPGTVGPRGDGVEPHAAKVKAINSGRSAIKEPNLDQLVSDGVASGRLRATQEGGPLVATADISLICVGTPSAADGGQNLTYLRNVASEIGRGLRQTNQLPRGGGPQHPVPRHHPRYSSGTSGRALGPTRRSRFRPGQQPGIHA